MVCFPQWDAACTAAALGLAAVYVIWSGWRLLLFRREVDALRRD